MKHSIKIILIFVLAVWICFFISRLLPVYHFGLVPRENYGLLGVITAPFLHASLSHVIGNSISFIVFAFLLASIEGNKMLGKIISIAVLGGILTWLFGRNAIHIGASGLVFGLWGYLVMSGWFSRKLEYILVAIVLMFFYGGMLYGVLPSDNGVSWESHLFGLVAGVFVSWVYHRNNSRRRR